MKIITCEKNKLDALILIWVQKSWFTPEAHLQHNVVFLIVYPRFIQETLNQNENMTILIKSSVNIGEWNHYRK